MEPLANHIKRIFHLHEPKRLMGDEKFLIFFSCLTPTQNFEIVKLFSLLQMLMIGFESQKPYKNFSYIIITAIFCKKHQTFYACTLRFHNKAKAQDTLNCLKIVRKRMLFCLQQQKLKFI